MTRATRQLSIRGQAKIQSAAKSYRPDNGRSARLGLRLYELDKDYHYQLKHMKILARQARFSFTEFNRSTLDPKF